MTTESAPPSPDRARASAQHKVQFSVPWAVTSTSVTVSYSAQTNPTLRFLKITK